MVAFTKGAVVVDNDAGVGDDGGGGGGGGGKGRGGREIPVAPSQLLFGRSDDDDGGGGGGRGVRIGCDCCNGSSESQKPVLVSIGTGGE